MAHVIPLAEMKKQHATLFAKAIRCEFIQKICTVSVSRFYSLPTCVPQLQNIMKLWSHFFLTKIL